MMITFTLTLPTLTDEQQLALEETLLRLPQVDAIALESGDFSITAAKENEVLRGLVAALYSWASNYAGMLRQMNIVCGDERSLTLIRHSPNDVIHFLALC